MKCDLGSRNRAICAPIRYAGLYHARLNRAARIRMHCRDTLVKERQAHEPQSTVAAGELAALAATEPAEPSFLPTTTWRRWLHLKSAPSTPAIFLYYILLGEFLPPTERPLRLAPPCSPLHRCTYLNCICGNISLRADETHWASQTVPQGIKHFKRATWASSNFCRPSAVRMEAHHAVNEMSDMV